MRNIITRILLAAFLVGLFPLSAQAGECTTRDAVAEEASRNAFTVTEFSGPTFDAWLKAVIDGYGEPPSGIIPTSALIITGPNPLVAIVYLFKDDDACDFLVV